MHRTGKSKVIQLAGIMAGRGDEAREKSTWAELAPSKETIIVDLAGVAALSQETLATLLRFRSFVRGHGLEVGLSALEPKVRLQAQKIQLHRMFEIFNTPEEAGCFDSP